MKVIRITSTAILSLLLGIAAPAYAQREQQGERQDHPEQQQSKQEHGKPEQQHAQQQQDQKKPQQHTQQQQRQAQNKQQEHAQQQQQNQKKQIAQKQRNHQQPQRTQQQQQIQRTAWQQHGSQNWGSDHRTWQQRGGYHGYRIPDRRFRGYFGPSHGFRIYGLPFLVVGGYPRFQYQGYWFSPVDPWPTYWGNDWYDNDDVYVNYVDNGYYLYNRRHPEVAIAINISL